MPGGTHAQYCSFCSSTVSCNSISHYFMPAWFSLPFVCRVKGACTYGRLDCAGREIRGPMDGTIGECRCDRFLGFTGPFCDETYGCNIFFVGFINRGGSVGDIYCNGKLNDA